MKESDETYPLFFGIPEDRENPNLSILGVPWYASSSFRKCSTSGTRILRKATTSKLYNSYSEFLVNLVDFWRMIDLGDISVSGKDYDYIVKAVVNVISKFFRENFLYMFLGGDHSITYATVNAIHHLYGKKFGLIYFDAHPDLYLEYEGDRFSHACVLRRILENKFVKPENVIIVGLRASTREQMDVIRENNIKAVTAREIYINGLGALSEKIRDLKENVDMLYLSYDLDVLDPAFAPGVGNPEPGGLSTRELVDIIQEFEEFKIIGFDITEYCLKYDTSRITAFAAAKIIKETLGTAAKKYTQKED
ncbi:MAG: agmatinase [Candidatus Njordarchaeia archaeon]